MTCAAPCTRRGRTCHGRPAALAGLGRARRTRGGFSRSGATTPSHQRTGARPRSWGTPRRARSSAASRNRAPAWVVAKDTTTSGWARSARTATRACRSTARRRLCRRRRRHRSRCARRGREHATPWLLGAAATGYFLADLSVTVPPVGAPAGRVAIPRFTTSAGGRALFKEIPHATRVVVGELRGAMGAIDDDHILATDASGVWSPSARAIIPSDRRAPTELALVAGSLLNAARLAV